MAEQRERPWWRRLDGLPPSRPLPRPDSLNGRLSRVMLRHPSRYGWGVGAFVAICWMAIFRFVNGAGPTSTVLLGLGTGILWGLLQTEAMKVQARRQGMRND